MEAKIEVESEEKAFEVVDRSVNWLRELADKGSHKSRRAEVILGLLAGFQMYMEHKEGSAAAALEPYAKVVLYAASRAEGHPAQDPFGQPPTGRMEFRAHPGYHVAVQ